MDLSSYLRLLVRRSWLLALLIAVGATAAWYATRNEAPVSERAMAFVVRPADNLPLGDIDDTLDELAADGAVVQSVIGALNSRRFREQAIERSRVGSADITIEATGRSGSDVIDVRFQSERPQVINPVSDRFASLLTAWVSETYKIYELESLGAEAEPRLLPARAKTMIGLGAFAGLLFGLAAILLEGIARLGASPPARASGATNGSPVRYEIVSIADGARQ